MSKYNPPETVAESHSIIYLCNPDGKGVVEDEYIVNFNKSQDQKTILVKLHRIIKNDERVKGFIKIKSTLKLK